MTITLPVTVFLSVSLLAWALLDALFSDDRRVSRRLKGLTEYEADQAREAEPLLRPFAERVLRPMGGPLLRLARFFEPQDYRGRIRKRLRAAGDPRGMDAERFMLAKTVMTLGALGFWGSIWLLAGWSFGRGLVAVALFGGVAFLLPDLWLRMALKRRRARLRRELPDALDMLTISIEAGLGFDQAVAKLVKNSDGPLAEELGRMLQEVQSGASRRDALRDLAERTEVPDIRTFVSTLVQADIFGISIANVLRVQSKEMRLKRRQAAEEQAQKAPVKIVFPLVLCILPATFVVILGPSAMAIAEAFGL